MVAVKELKRRKTSLNLLFTLGILMRLRAMEPAERALTFRLLEKEKVLEVFELMEHSEQNELVRAMEYQSTLFAFLLCSLGGKNKMLVESRLHGVRRRLRRRRTTPKTQKNAPPRQILC